MPDDLVTVGTYWDPNEAAVFKLKLETAGIRSYLSNDTTVGMLWHLANATGGVRLQVSAVDEHRARRTIAENNANELAEEFPEFGVDVDEESPNRREQDADRAFRGALVGLILFPLHLYVVWLVLKVFVSRERLRARHLRNARIATLISFAYLATLYLIARTAAVNG